MKANQIRTLYLAGYLWCGVLLFLSFLYYRERTLFLDIPFHLFELTRTGTFAIQNYRFVAVLTQWLPLAGIKAGLPLKSLMILYSLAFPLLYLVVYAVCGWLKQYKVALAWLLSQTIFATHTFFWIQSEMPQGLAILFLCAAILLVQPIGKPGRILQACSLALLLPMLALSHPLMLFPFFSMVGYLWFYQSQRKYRMLLIGTALIFAAAYFIKSRWLPTAYDTAAMGGIKNIGRNLLYINKLASTKFLLRKWVGAYLLMPIGFAVVWIALRRNGAPVLKQLIVLAVFWAYLLLIVLTNTDESTPAFYRENLLLPLGAMLSIPMVFEGMPHLRRFSMAVLCLLFAGAAARFIVVSRQYQQRVAYLRQYWHEHGNEKILAQETQQHRDALIMTWATPYEFWLLSTAESEVSASIIIHEHPQELEWATHDARLFVTRWGTFSYQTLPARYFHFSDTTSTYQLVQ